MKVTFKNSVLTVVTAIPEATAKKGYTNMVVADEKKGELYRVEVATSSVGTLSKFAMKSNAVVDGNLAVVIPCGADAKQEDVMKTYGEALIAADTYTVQIAAQAEAKEAQIAGFFTAE